MDSIRVQMHDAPSLLQGLRRVVFGLEGSPGRDRLHRLTNRLSALLYSSLLSSWPRAIELETISACNGGCTFCPVNREVDPRPPARMAMELMEKIAAELGEGGYAGHLALFSNNEPLLDPRLPEICRLFRAKVPRAWIYVYTNGTPLTARKFDALFDAGLDELVINNYSDGRSLVPQVARLLHEIDGRSGRVAAARRQRTRVLVRSETEILTTRAGTAPNRPTSRRVPLFRQESCGLPYSQMVIRPTGEVSLCCQDALGQATLGNVAVSSVREVWNGPGFERVRAVLEASGRGGLPLCGSCDAYLLQPQIVTRVVRRWIRRPFLQSHRFPSSRT